MIDTLKKDNYYSKISNQFLEIIKEINQKEEFEIQSIIDNFVENEAEAFIDNELSDLGSYTLGRILRGLKVDLRQLGYTETEILNNMIKIITKPSIGFLIKLNPEGLIEKSKLIVTRMNSASFGNYIIFNYSQSSNFIDDFISLLSHDTQLEPDLEKLIEFNLNLLEELQNEYEPKVKLKKIKKIIYEVNHQVKLDEVANIVRIIIAIKNKKPDFETLVKIRKNEDTLLLSQIDLLAETSKELNNIDATKVGFLSRIWLKRYKKNLVDYGYLYRIGQAGIGYFFNW